MQWICFKKSTIYTGKKSNSAKMSRPFQVVWPWTFWRNEPQFEAQCWKARKRSDSCKQFILREHWEPDTGRDVEEISRIPTGWAEERRPSLKRPCQKPNPHNWWSQFLKQNSLLSIHTAPKIIENRKNILHSNKTCQDADLAKPKANFIKLKKKNWNDALRFWNTSSSPHQSIPKPYWWALEVYKPEP